MARSRRVPNGTHQNTAQPPPSTLAAQIVQNQTQSTTSYHGGTTASFSQLLHEILHNHAAAPETDLATNVKLIGVVAEVGLAPLAEEHPFSVRSDESITQAKDSIAVIRATIERQSAVLLSQVSVDGPQLLLPLLAQLAAVCGRQGCENLPIHALLDAIFRSLGSSLEYWPHKDDLRLVLQECVDDILTALERANGTFAGFALKTPPFKSVTRLWPGAADAITLPAGCQSTINHPAHAFTLALDFASQAALAGHWQNDSILRLQRLLKPLRAKLELAQQYESALLRLLSTPHNLLVLAETFDTALTQSLSVAVQSTLAKELVNAIRLNPVGAKDALFPCLIGFVSNDRVNAVETELRIAAVCSIHFLHNDDDELTQEYWTVRHATSHDEPMAVESLDSRLYESSERHLMRKKRRKTVCPQHPDRSAYLTRRVLECVARGGDLARSPQISANIFSSKREDEQCATWQALLELMDFEPASTLTVVSQLIGHKDFHQTSRARVLSLLAIRKIALDCSDPAYLDLESSALGQYCLKSLRSSAREARITAGQCLSAFLRSGLPNDLLTRNRRNALEFLRVLSERGGLSEHETLVGTWGTVGITCGVDELNLALLRLIEYLGYPNPMVSSLAFAEIEKLADAAQQSVEQLCKPFWNSIAISVVQDLQNRPQKIQQLCDLLGVSINHFLISTQQETVPSLVFAKRGDVLQRIAAARGETVTIQDVCLQPRTHLAVIVAFLLVQYGQSAETAAMTCLIDVVPGFKNTDLVDLIKTDPMLIACSLLKFISDLPTQRKAKGYQAFHVFATLAEKGSGATKALSKSSRFVAEFFGTYILGIMTFFSQILEDPLGVQPTSEKMLCLKAIAEMITLAKREVAGALPQVRACLQSAMEQPPLCETAFSAWLKLLSVLDVEDMANMIDQTFALILRYWSSLSAEHQQSTYDMVAQLIKNHNKIMQDRIMTIPNLSEIPLLSKFGGEIERLRKRQDVGNHFKAFTMRLKDESKIVVTRAAEELVPYLEENQGFVHDSAVSEQPTVILSDLMRALLDATAKYSTDDDHSADTFGKALGIVGCLDPNRVETTRKKKGIVVLSNFEVASEVVDWAIILLEEVLVKVFKSVSNSRAQGFVAYVIQELLRFCGFNDPNALRPRGSQVPSPSQRFSDLPDHIRIILTPLISSKYVMTSNNANPPDRAYPGFSAAGGHGSWLRQLVYDLTWKAKGDNAQMVFPLLARLIRGHDLTIASFILPYAILNVVLGGTVSEVKGISDEFLAVLQYEPANSTEQEAVKLCSESVFSTLDYMSTWLREKKKVLGENRTNAYRTGHSPADFDETKDMDQISTIEKFLSSVPAQLIATRAAMCGSYARALSYWEQHIRHERPLVPSLRAFPRDSPDAAEYDQLQRIYAQIDEPDGLEGISAHLTFLSEDQQAIQHAKAGRWTVAQTWYEIQLSKDPGNVEIEEKLLSCLRETGRYDPLLRYAEAFSHFRTSSSHANLSNQATRLLPMTLEAHWMSGNLESMNACLKREGATSNSDFNVGMARILSSLASPDDQSFTEIVSRLRVQVAQSMTIATTTSIQASHEDLRKLHVLYEAEALRSGNSSPLLLEKRLATLGSYVSDKQYVLGLRRALMAARKNEAGSAAIGEAWLTTAKLARQSGNTESAYNAVLRAYECGIRGAKLEEARLLWRDGHQRHAIQSLEATIESGVLDIVEIEPHESSDESQPAHKQKTLSAKAHLLLAKWLDASGQRQAKDMTEKYQYAVKHFQRWEKGHYYLGKHYQKLLEAEKALPEEKQTALFVSGDITRLVIENQTRSIAFGNKYWHQTIPKIFTLWLDLGNECVIKDKAELSNRGRSEAHSKSRSDAQSMAEKRAKSLQAVNRLFLKYFDRVPPYVFYSALPQLISRITHPHSEVWKVLSGLLVKIVATYPNQALWSILAVVKASDSFRVEKGYEILHRVKDPKLKPKSSGSPTDLKIFIAQAQKLSDGLLNACEAQVKERVREVSLAKDLGFNHKLAPSQLVVPIELTLTASGPTNATIESIRQHKPFIQDKITISAFLDEVLVLSSLQRPRKVTVRGSDGKPYGLLCKPKDDLRKDQRLMEFNGVINRALKRDAESSKRRLYIKTYAVTPLSEESGTIEWVEGIKPLRDILLNIYARKSIRPDYTAIRNIMQEASSSPQNLHIFKDKVLRMFPASLHEWFAEVYPEPDVWFAARLRYARSAAVTSMSGHVLGLGDRHGENILLEEGSGGVFHVDFNCLFDKGLTFEKPELVPFRLTHNMVDAMGPYGYEGPYRKSCELTLRLLRQSKDTLMTVLETFLYDPTTDFVGKKKRSTAGVPDTPQGILDSVDAKLKGLLRGETVPLSVEGYVDALIRQATDHFNLASMYIGWCAFL